MTHSDSVLLLNEGLIKHISMQLLPGPLFSQEGLGLRLMCSMHHLFDIVPNCPGTSGTTSFI